MPVAGSFQFLVVWAQIIAGPEDTYQQRQQEKSQTL